MSTFDTDAAQGVLKVTTRGGRMAGKNWIAGAIKHPGALTQQAKKAGKSPMAFARAKKGAPGKTGKRARLALTLAKFRKK